MLGFILEITYFKIKLDEIQMGLFINWLGRKCLNFSPFPFPILTTELKFCTFLLHISKLDYLKRSRVDHDVQLNAQRTGITHIYCKQLLGRGGCLSLLIHGGPLLLSLMDSGDINESLCYCSTYELESWNELHHLGDLKMQEKMILVP